MDLLWIQPRLRGWKTADSRPELWHGTATDHDM